MRQGEFLSPPGWDAGMSIAGLPRSIRLAGTHSYTRVKRGTLTVTHLELNVLTFQRTNRITAH